MTAGRTVVFQTGGLASQLSEVEWPVDLSLPPKGSRVIEMPNGHHKGLVRDSIGDLYHCIDGYNWTLG